MKILKKALKITGIVLASFLLFLIIVVVVAKLFENDLATYAMDELEKEIEAPMSIGKVSVIPLFSFPRFSAEINDLWVGEPGSNRNDSIFNLKSIKVGLDTWDLINGIYTIDKLEISGLRFDYNINSKGKSNIDFLIHSFTDTTGVNDDRLPDTTQTMSALFLTAHKGRLTEINIKYYDTTTNTAANIYIPEIYFRAKTRNDKYEIDAEGRVLVNNCCFEDTRLDRMESGELDFRVNFDDGRLRIEQFEVITEGAKLNLEGASSIGDTISTDVQLVVEGMDFHILKKYIPDEYQQYVPALTSGDIAPVYLGLNMNYYNDDVFLQTLDLKTEGIDLAMDGAVKLGDTILIDAGLEAKALDYRVIKKFVTEQMLQEYGILDIGGNMALSVVVNGKYADSTLMPGIVAEVSIDQLKLVTRDYPEISVLNFEGVIKNKDLSNLDNTTIDIAELAVFTPKSNINLTGDLQGIENVKYNLSASARVDLSEFEQYIPDSLARNVSGMFDVRLQSSGMLPDSITDAFIDEALNHSSFDLQCDNVSGIFMDSLLVNQFGFKAQYTTDSSKTKNVKLNNLRLIAKSENLDLSNGKLNMDLTGQMGDLSQLVAHVKNFNVQQGSNVFSGNAHVKNFEKPAYDLKVSIHLNLPELMRFMPDSLIQNISGRASLTVYSSGIVNPDSIEAQLYPILFENSRFKLSCGDVSLAFVDSMMNVEGITAGIQFENDELTVEKFSATYNGLKVEVDSTRVNNIYKAVLLNDHEELYVKTHLRLGNFHYNDFEPLIAMAMAEGESETREPEAEDEPQNWTYLIHGTVSVNSLTVDTTVIEGYQVNRLDLRDISTLFKLTDSAYIVDQFKFKAFDGETNNSFFYRIREDGTETVSSRHNLKDINVRMLLKDLDNLELDSMITWQNITGRLSSELNMFYPLDSSMIEKMLISGDVVLEEGGVFNYGPAEEMSKFTRIKELDNIQFKTLRSNIFMFKNRIWIPHTDIVSNALDIAAFGMFDMNYDYDYRLEIHLRDILFGKSKRRNRKQDAKGEEVDEKTLKKSSRKIRYADVDGETKMGLDSKESREEMMNKIRVQKKMLDFIFFPKNIHYSTDVPENM